MATFSASGPAPLSTVSLQGSQSPTIANVSIPLANTEVSYSLPAATKRFIIRLRGAATLKLAYSAGTSGTTYLSIYAGSEYQETDLSLPTGLTIYFQSTQSSQTAEIVSWS